MKLGLRIFLVGIFLCCWAARAGQEAHGGGVLVCPDKVLLYDLFEGEIPGLFSPEGIKTVLSWDPVETQVQNAIGKIRDYNRELSFRIKTAYEHAKSVAQKLPTGYTLPTPTDMDADILMEGCDLKGVASFDDYKDKLWIAGGLYDRMPFSHQAALWFHEAVYWEFRKSSERKDSKNVQELVAYTFSDQEIPFGNIRKAVLFDSQPNGGDEQATLYFQPEISKDFRIWFESTTPKLKCRSDGHVWLNPDETTEFGRYVDRGEVLGGKAVRLGTPTRMTSDWGGVFFWLGYIPSKEDNPECRYQYTIEDFRNDRVLSIPVYESKKHARYQADVFIRNFW